MAKLLFKYSFTGTIPRANRMYGHRCIPNKRSSKPAYLPIVFMTKEYKDFKKKIEAQVPAKHYTGKIDLDIKVWFYRLKDTDSFIKPFLDAIESAGLVEDDKQVRDINIQREYHKRREQDHLEVSVYTADPRLELTIQRPKAEGKDE